MSDNIQISGGTIADSTVATDDVGGVQYERVKIDLGADGVASPLVRGQQTAANSIPVTLPSDQPAVTVSGTVAATQSGTWTVQPGNTANTTAWKVDGSAVTQPVSAVSLPLPSGASTAAKQPALGTAGASSADVISVQGIASGTALPVSAAALPLPSGASTSANQTTIIGHVDGIEGLLTTIDADTGTIAGAVSGTEMQVDVLTVPAPLSTTGGGTEATALRVTLANDSTGLVSVDDNGSSLTVDGTVAVSSLGGTVAVTQSGTWDEVGINDSGNSLTVDAPVGTPVFVRLSDGSSAITTLPVSLASVPSHAVTNAGTFAVQDSTAQASLSVMDDWDNTASDGASVSGDVAHDSADAGEPVKVGGKATNSLEGVTQVANNDRTNIHVGLDGTQIVRPFTTSQEILSERISNTDGASTACTVFDAGGTNVRNYITTIIAHNAHASTNGYVDIRDGTAGSVLATIPLPATGGAVVPFTIPLRQTTTNTALAYDVSAAITTVYLTFVGYQAKEV